MWMASSCRKLVRLFVLAASVALISIVGSLLAAPAAHAGTNCNITQPYSVRGDNPVTITFTNGTFQQVDLYWLNYNPPGPPGTHYAYYNSIGATIEGPSPTLDQPTWETHPWVALDPTFLTCLGYTIGGAENSSYTILNPPFQVTAAPTIAGFVNPDKPVGVNHGTYLDDTVAYTYTWERCDSFDFQTCVPIAGSDGDTYTPGAADEGHFIRAQETATNSLGLSESTPTPVEAVGTAMLSPSINCNEPCNPYPGAENPFTGLVSNTGPDGASPVSLSINGFATNSAEVSLDSATFGGSPCSVDNSEGFFGSCRSPGVLDAGKNIAWSATFTILSVPDGGTLTVTVQPNSDTPLPSGTDGNSASATIDLVDTVPVATVAEGASADVAPTTVPPGAQEIPTSAIDLTAVSGGTGSTESAPIASIPIASIPIASIPIA